MLIPSCILNPCLALLMSVAAFAMASAVESQLLVTATDDGLPTPAALTYTWTAKSFPAAAVGAAAAQILSTPSSAVPNATAQNPRIVLSVAGTYVFHVSVSDGALTTEGTPAQDVTVVVNPPVNTPPTISTIANQLVAKGSATIAIPFTIGDKETAATSLGLSATSSAPGLVPVANIVFGGSGASRTVVITPAAGQSGTAVITIQVTDAGGAIATSAFTIVVNAPPVITGVSAAATTLTLP